MILDQGKLCEKRQTHAVNCVAKRMRKRVALLADGRNSDLYASFCAVKLAKRMDATLCSILLVPDPTEFETKEEMPDMGSTWKDFSPSFFLQLVSGLCGLEKVENSYHLIEDASDDALIEFLVSQRISCLIAGSLDEKDFHQKKRWSSLLMGRVQDHPGWYWGAMTVFLARPWTDECFKRILKQIDADCSLYPIEIASV